MSAACRCISFARIARVHIHATSVLVVVPQYRHFRFPFAFRLTLVSRHLWPSLILSSFLVVLARPLAATLRHCRKVDTSTSALLSPPFSSSTRAFGDHCALQRPIIPMQAEFKEVNSGANVFTPFYLNPRRFRMYCQFCIYTPARPPTPARSRAVHE